MANGDGKRSGCFFWILLGFLLGVVVTLAVVFMSDMKSGSDYDRDKDDAPPETARPVETPAVAPPKVTPPAPVAKTERPHAPGIDPSTDEQINDDLAASGATSRRKAPPAPTPAPIPDPAPQTEEPPTN